MNDLIIQEGNNESFCDITIVDGLYINNVQRKEYPLDFDFFLFKKVLREDKNLQKQRSIINVFILNTMNLYKATEEVYGIYRDKFWLPKGSERKLDYDMIHDLKYVLDIIPQKYIIKGKYKACCIPHNIENLHITFIKIRSSGLAYLKSKYKNDEKYLKIISLLTKLEQGKTNVDFDESINKWSKDLLKGDWKIQK